MRLLRTCFIMVFIFTSSVVTAEEVLIGAAEQSRFKRSHFIGGLYASADASKDTVFAGDTAAKMRIQVTAKRISERVFTDSWVQGIAVNNSAEKLESSQREILRFASLFEGPLYADDVVDIATDGKEVTVSLDGVMLGSFKSKQLFPILLSTWIGPVPLSTPFKNGIRGDITDASLEQSLAALKASEERVAEVNSWVTQQPVVVGSSAPASAAKPIPAAVKQVPVAVAEKSVVKATPKPPVSAPIKTNTVAKSELPVAIAAKNKPVPADVPVKPEQASVKKADPQAASITLSKSESTVQPQREAASVADAHSSTSAAQSAASETIEKNGKEEKLAEQKSAPAEAEKMATETVLSDDELATQLLVRQSYYARLVKEVNTYKYLPRQAIARRVSGEVRVEVEIDRHGKIMDTGLVEASKYDFFNKQALEAVHKAEPFEPVPDQLSGESFAFEVLIFYPPYF